MTIDIRPARASDVDSLAAIENAAFEGDRISKKSFRRLIRGRTAAVLVAASAGAVLGYAVVLFREGARVGRLYSIAADRTRHGAGLGRALLEAAEAAAHRRGLGALRLEVRQDNARARALYERNGYRVIGSKPHYYFDGATALRYEKALQPAAGVAGGGGSAHVVGTVS
jgi:ribosomal protein S18 acetylase RimI-like enzyme